MTNAETTFQKVWHLIYPGDPMPTVQGDPDDVDEQAVRLLDALRDLEWAASERGFAQGARAEREAAG